MKKDLRYYMNLPYTITIDVIPAEEGGGYSASIPQLGKFALTSDGETIEEAIHNLEKIKQDRFSDYLKKGLTIPEPQRDEEEYSGNFVARIPKYLHRELALRARSNGVSLNQFVVSLLSGGLEGERYTSALHRYEKEIGLLRSHVCALTFNIDPKLIFPREFLTSDAYQSDDQAA
jgi:antitoxin HicB